MYIFFLKSTPNTIIGEHIADVLSPNRQDKNFYTTIFYETLDYSQQIQYNYSCIDTPIMVIDDTLIDSKSNHHCRFFILNIATSLICSSYRVYGPLSYVHIY